MAEQRVNALGEVVEYSEDSQRWVPVKDSDGQAQVSSEPVSGFGVAESSESVSESDSYDFE